MLRVRHSISEDRLNLMFALKALLPKKFDVEGQAYLLFTPERELAQFYRLADMS